MLHVPPERPLVYVIKHDGEECVIVDQWPDLKVESQPGEVYEVQRSFNTLKGERYSPGDLLVVIGRTKDSPYGWKCTSGNLRIRGKDGDITVWSSFEGMIIDRSVKRLPVQTWDEAI